MKKKLRIAGMSCPKCVQHLKAALEEVEGVRSVEVDLARGEALIEASEARPDEVWIDVVEEAGYEVEGIETLPG